MRRAVALVTILALVAVGCSSQAEPTSTTTTTSSTTTTVATTTTTTAPTTTTTTIPPVTIEGAGRPLTRLIRSLYDMAEGGEGPRAPEGVRTAFAEAKGQAPRQGKASVAAWGENVRLGVVKLGNDVTLAVADPDWRVVGGWWPSMKIGPKLGAFPKIVAVAGSDARPDENREATRTDSIHFVGMDARGNAGIVGVPRDSWVPIPGAGTSKINAALSFGGPEMMMDTFTELSGLEFDGYLLTGFAGFESLIEILGGLTIDVPRDFNDQAAKAYLEAGEQMLNAAEALALSRTRKTLPRGDFQRQEHGGLVLMAAQAMVRANGVLGLPGMLAASRPHFSTDLAPAELLRIAAVVVRVKPDQVVNVVAPGGTGSAGGASVVFLNDAATDELWTDLADGSLEPPQ